MYAITVAGFVLWTAYGVLIESPAVIAANSVCLTLSAAILVLKWRFSRETGRGKDSLNQAS
jgi:MtN3 and saliva related transmembrane protein